MRKTLFIGLTVLNPDETVTADNGAFTGRDRDTIDRFLELGAKTHRHDAHAGLSNPPSLMAASAIASGGTLSAGEEYSLAYTLEDSEGGETLLAPVVTFSTPPPISPPFAALTGNAVYGEGGDLPTDTYYYAYSFVDGSGGETPIGPARGVEREPGFPEAKIVLSGFKAPMEEAEAAGWRLYRAVGGGDFGYMTSGTANTFTDDGSLECDCDLTPLPSETNTTNGDNSFEILLPSADVYVASGTSLNVYMSNNGEFVGDVLLEQFPVASAGQKVLYRSIDLLEGQPPDVNTSIGGASKIDPDTELIDWHWKRPVESVEDLPEEAENGDVRAVLSETEPTIYFYWNGAWKVYKAPPKGGLTLFSSGSAAAGVSLSAVEEIELLGSAGVNLKETEPEESVARVVVEGQAVTLANEGMGVLVCTVAEKGRSRPKAFKQYTWICKEQPTNMAEFDIWIEAGP